MTARRRSDGRSGDNYELWVRISSVVPGTGRIYRGGWRGIRFQDSGGSQGGRTVCGIGRVIVGGDGALGLAVLFVVVSLDDVADHRAGSFAAVLSAFLHQDRNTDFGVAFGGVADEPGVVGELGALEIGRAH